MFNFAFEVEHVVPTSQGGSDDTANLCLACRACNLRKADRLVFRDDEIDEDVRLYHPREQPWDQHFTVDGHSGQIHGTTPTGRATVACLDLNHPLQLVARQLWICLEMFP